MRRLVAVLAVAVAALQLLLFLVTEQQARVAISLIGSDVELTALRWAWAVLAPLPWLAGAGLLCARRPRLGTAVLLAAAPLLVAAGLPTLPAVVVEGWWRDAAAFEVLAVVGPPVVLLLAVAVAALAWWSRPRGGWRRAVPGPSGAYVAVAVLAWLPTALQTLELSPPGAMRSFARTELSRLDGIEAVASVTGAVVAAALLFVAPRLREDVGGAILLVFAVPQLTSAIGDLAQVRETEFLIVTPPAVLGMVGLVGVLVVAVRWLVVTSSPPPAGDDGAAGPRPDQAPPG
ncbi:MAG: hypothetical protein R6V28_12640 [Nitriliruptoraceae bacterium]